MILVNNIAGVKYPLTRINDDTYYVLESDGHTKITLFCGVNGSVNPLLVIANNPIIKSPFPKL